MHRVKEFDDFNKKRINFVNVRPPPPPPIQNFEKIGPSQLAKKPPPPPPPGVVVNKKQQEGPGYARVVGKRIVPTAPEAMTQRTTVDKDKTWRAFAGPPAKKTGLPIADKMRGVQPKAETKTRGSFRLEGLKPITLQNKPHKQESNTYPPKTGEVSQTQQVVPKLDSPTQQKGRDHKDHHASSKGVTLNNAQTTAPPPTAAKAPSNRAKYPLRPFSKNISIMFTGGPPPKFNRETYESSLDLSRTNPTLLRKRVRADVRFLRQNPRCSNRIINYGLFKAYSLSISELKQLFGASTLTELVALCESTKANSPLFGEEVGESVLATAAKTKDNRKRDCRESDLPELGSDLANMKAVIKDGPKGQYVERVPISSTECKKGRDARPGGTRPPKNPPNFKAKQQQMQTRLGGGKVEEMETQTLPKPVPEEKNVFCKTTQTNSNNMKQLSSSGSVPLDPQSNNKTQNTPSPRPVPAAHGETSPHDAVDLPMYRRDTATQDMPSHTNVVLATLPCRTDSKEKFKTHEGLQQQNDKTYTLAACALPAVPDLQPMPSMSPACNAQQNDATVQPRKQNADTPHENNNTAHDMHWHTASAANAENAQDKPPQQERGGVPRITKIATEELSRLNPKAPPVPQSLRHLPPDHPEVVLREPDRFGTTRVARDEKVIYIQLNKIPTALTHSEKEFAFRCEKTGHTSKHQYQDTRQILMYRCPLSSCGHAVINNKTVPGSIGAHLREYHGGNGQKYQVHYMHKGQNTVYQHGFVDASKKQQIEADLYPAGTAAQGFNGKRQRPHYTQPKILDAFLKMRRQAERGTTVGGKQLPAPDPSTVPENAANKSSTEKDRKEIVEEAFENKEDEGLHNNSAPPSTPAPQASQSKLDEVAAETLHKDILTNFPASQQTNSP